MLCDTLLPWICFSDLHSKYESDTLFFSEYKCPVSMWLHNKRRKKQKERISNMFPVEFFDH